MTNKTNPVNIHAYKRSFKKTIGKILIEERLARNIRIEFLSKQLQIQIKSIEQIELGQSDYNWLTLYKILDFYNKQISITLVDNKP